MTKYYLTLSVHQLVDFLLRQGDIDNRVYNSTTMQEGSKIHAQYQAKQSKHYIAEYPLSCSIYYEDFEIKLEGRADGVDYKNDLWTIDEIKSTVQELPEYRKSQLYWHLGQAKCYAYMLCLEKKLTEVGVRMIYIRQGKKEKLVDNYSYTFKELEFYVQTLVSNYLDFYRILLAKADNRNESIKTLDFPFNTYRKGQRKLALLAYSIGKKGGKLYAEAPTGIGKTMSTLYPFIKALSNDPKQKIFYLTAKNSGREAAKHAVDIMREKGLKITDVLVRAKDKICFCPGKACNPEECPYTKGYYDKIKDVIRTSLLTHNSFDPDTVIEIAKKEEMCPFELELDLSLYSDIIVCDYSYAFDPLVYMKRYFDDDSSSFLFLVDEVHNLVDRSKDMYSASISSSTLSIAKRSAKQIKNRRLKNQFKKLSDMFESFELSMNVGQTIVPEFSSEVFKIVNNVYDAFSDINKTNHDDMTSEIVDLQLELYQFIRINEFVSDNYIQYVDIKEYEKKKIITLKYCCLDASRFIRSRLRTVKGSILFSATLSPIDYYVNVLGGSFETDPYLLLPSPFPKENFKVLLAPKVSVKYTKRDESYPIVASYIKEFVSHKVGNYLIFFPSYEYLNNIITYLSLDEFDVFIQEKEMSETDREDYISNFKANPTKTTIGLAIIGGAFSEGIDLVDDRLIGAAIIGIGLPKVNFESDQIAKYYQSNNLPGKDYAYTNPGINKVMQAMGRVIRSEKDKGAVLLIDDRYMSSKIADEIRKEYPQYEVVLDINDISKQLSKFFKE